MTMQRKSAMHLRRQQLGLGTLGWLIAICLGAFVLNCAFKVGPVYLEYWQTKKSLDMVLNNSQVAKMAKPELLSALQKQLDVSTIESIKASDIKVIDSRDGREVNANYEKRVPLIYNIDVIVKFEHLVYKLSSSE